MTPTPNISKNYISSLIPAGGIILDVGSYNGKDAQELAEACSTDVHCFEPCESSVALICELKDPRLYIWPYALGSIHGQVRINLAPNHPQSNTLRMPKMHRKVFPGVIYKGSTNIQCTTLDRWSSKQFGATVVDLIWCDVNGAEADFILGGLQTLSRTRWLYIEYSVKELFSKGLNREQLLKALPGFAPVSDHNVGPNYGNLFLKNKNTRLWDDVTSAQ